MNTIKNDLADSRARSPYRFRAKSLATLLTLILLWGTQTLAFPSTAHAAATGEVSTLVLKSHRLTQGSSGTLEFHWSFSAGSGVGDTATITAADNFTLSAPVAHPQGQDVFGEDGVILATVTVTGNVVTITRKVDTSWGDVASQEAASVSFDYDGTIRPGETQTTVWPTSSGPQPIDIIGLDPAAQAAYYPHHRLPGLG